MAASVWVACNQSLSKIALITMPGAGPEWLIQREQQRRRQRRRAARPKTDRKLWPRAFSHAIQFIDVPQVKASNTIRRSHDYMSDPTLDRRGWRRYSRTVDRGDPSSADETPDGSLHWLPRDEINQGWLCETSSRLPRRERETQRRHADLDYYSGRATETCVDRRKDSSRRYRLFEQARGQKKPRVIHISFGRGESVRNPRIGLSCIKAYCTR